MVTGPTKLSRRAVRRTIPAWRASAERPSILAGMEAAFQKHGDELVRALLDLTKSDDERVRLGAIQAALDRGWGRPTQAVDLGVEVQITAIERHVVDPQVIKHERGGRETGAGLNPVCTTGPR